MTIGGLVGIVRIYETPFDEMQHVVAVFGDVRGREKVPVRIHREQPVTDLFGRTRDSKTWVEVAVDRIGEIGHGVLMLLRTPQVDDFESEAAVTDHADGERHGSAIARRQRWREVGVGAQILRDLRIRSIAEIATHERAYVGLSGFGIEVAGTILIEG